MFVVRCLLCRADGSPVCWFGRTVIHSRASMTYDQVSSAARNSKRSGLFRWNPEDTHHPRDPFSLAAESLQSYPADLSCHTARSFHKNKNSVARRCRCQRMARCMATTPPHHLSYSYTKYIYTSKFINRGKFSEAPSYRHTGSQAEITA